MPSFDAMNFSAMNFLSNADFCAQRPQLLQEIIALKNLRRVILGPDMSVVFESPRLIWWHIQEMLRIENGGPAQLREEWEVYGSLMPSAESLVVTVMIEVMDPVARKKVLSQRQGIEHDLFLEGAGFRIRSEPVDGLGLDQEMQATDLPENLAKDAVCEKLGPESDSVDPSHPHVDFRADVHNSLGHKDGAHRQGGPTSSVHFLRFPLNQGVRNAFALGEPVLSCQHPRALYRAGVSRPLWAELCRDMGVVPLKY